MAQPIKFKDGCLQKRCARCKKYWPLEARYYWYDQRRGYWYSWCWCCHNEYQARRKPKAGKKARKGGKT